MDWPASVLIARNRLLASARFQKWAAALPLTRPIARRRARAVFDLCAGFVYSQILLACVRLGVLDRLRDGPLSLAQLATATGLTAERTRQLMEAAATLQLTQRAGGDRYMLGAHGAAILGNPAVLRMIEHHSLLYADLADPVALLRGEARETSLARYWPYASGHKGGALTPEQIEGYTRLMSSSQPLVSGDVLDAVRLDGYTKLLDIGGGDGTFLEAVGRRYASLRLALFDLPAVAERARERLQTNGLASRTEIHGGDFCSDPLPAGADIVTLVRVLHDHSDDRAKKLLASVRRILPADGALIIAEPMAGTRGAETMGDAYFGFYLMAMGSGRPRTPDEIGALLLEAGFSRSRSIATRIPLQTSLIEARA